jgi:hypothetical protein
MKLLKNLLDLLLTYTVELDVVVDFLKMSMKGRPHTHLGERCLLERSAGEFTNAMFNLLSDQQSPHNQKTDTHRSENESQSDWSDRVEER